MDAAATLVWIAPEPPDAAQSRALASWGRSRGVALESPREGRARPLPVDAAAAADVEASLDRARDALSARDGAGVDRALSAAEVALRAQPQLPQAAWLMAEVLRVRSTRLRRVAPVDEVAAAKAWQSAAALDGGRVAGIGEVAVAEAGPASTLALDAVPPGASARLDGRAVASATLETRAGLHVLAVVSEGAPVWAMWLEIPPGTTTVAVDAPVAPACSSGDVAHARVAGDGVDVAQVRCPAWVIATPGDPDRVRVALCEAGRCGPLVDWRSPPAWTEWSPSPEPRRGRWPTWATWGLVGAGAVAVGVVAVVASGVLAAAPGETRFVSGGVKTQ